MCAFSTGDCCWRKIRNCAVLAARRWPGRWVSFKGNPLLFFVNLPFTNRTNIGLVLSDLPKLFTHEEGTDSATARTTRVVSKNMMEAGDFKLGTRLRAER